MLSVLKNAMKKTTLLIVIVAVMSCGKKGKDDYSAVKESLISKWEARKSVGGFAGTIIYPPGNGSILEFKSGSSFADYYKDTIIRSGTYDLQSTSEKDTYRIIFHTNIGDDSEKVLLKADTLSVGRFEQCCDIPTEIFVRVN